MYVSKLTDMASSAAVYPLFLSGSDNQLIRIGVQRAAQTDSFGRARGRRGCEGEGCANWLEESRSDLLRELTACVQSPRHAAPTDMSRPMHSCKCGTTMTTSATSYTNAT